MAKKQPAAKRPAKRRTKPKPGDRLQEQIAKAHRARDAELERALRVWDELPYNVQTSVVREIVETRHQELRRAYEDVIGIAYGRRSRRKLTVTDECVTFLVKRKWAKSVKPTDPDRKLPEYLWAYAPTAWSSERVLCAVPTDVESLADGIPVPHGAGIDMMAANRRSPWTGAVTCAVQVPDDNGVHALTCFHVAGMPDRQGGVPAQPQALLRDGTTPVGPTWWDWTGNLVHPPERSFDAALIKVAPENLPALRRIVDGFTASAVLQPSESVPLRCKILVPGREPVTAIYKQTWIDYHHIGYFDNGEQPRHARLFEFEIRNPGDAVGGDSGSAVVNEAGWQFVGMYIAGVNGTTSRFVLPAYFLMEGANYGNEGELKLVTGP